MVVIVFPSGGLFKNVYKFCFEVVSPRGKQDYELEEGNTKQSASVPLVGCSKKTKGLLHHNALQRTFLQLLAWLFYEEALFKNSAT